MNKGPLISIITPSFNQGKFIEQTILSVLNQDYDNIEYIIVDGGSTDETVSILDKYRSRTDIVIQEKDDGQADAINKGFELASGELVGWINSDDLLYPNCISTIAELFRQNSDGAIYYGSRLDFIDAENRKIKQKIIQINQIHDLLSNNYNIIQQGSFYNRLALKEVGFLDAHLHYSMDLDVWLKLLKTGKIYHYDQSPLAAFRIWEDSKTSTGGIKFLRDISQTLRRHGSKGISRNSCRIGWYMMKEKVKQAIQR